jgi:hypothetical protein
MLKTNIEENIKYPGFYNVPGINFLAISKDGIFINLITKNIIKLQKNKKGYIKLSVQVNNKNYDYRAHRLIAITFIDKPDRHLNKSFNDLEVNHKDGNKENNSISNLEWVTSKENTQHAFDNDLIKIIRVIAKNIITNKEEYFQGIENCSRKFNIDPTALSKHLKSKNFGTITKNWYVFKIEDKSEWPILHDDDYVENSWYKVQGIWFAKNLSKDLVLISDTLKDLANILDFNYFKVKRFISKKQKDKTFFGWIFEYNKCPSSEHIKKIQKRKHKYKYKIKVTNLKTKEILYFDKFTEVALFIETTTDNIYYAISFKKGLIKNFLIEKEKMLSY